MSSATLAEPIPLLVAFLCPDCQKQGKHNVIIRAEKGALVEAFCWKCKFRKVVRIC